MPPLTTSDRGLPDEHTFVSRRSPTAQLTDAPAARSSSSSTALRTARLPADRARDRHRRGTQLVLDGARAPREPGAPRPAAPRPEPSRARSTSSAASDRRPPPQPATPGIRMLPLLGQIAAGAPMLAEEHVEELMRRARAADRFGRELPAARARRVDDRRRHPRRRLCRRPPPGDGRRTARSSRRSSTAGRPRSSASTARTAASGCSRPTPSMAPIYADDVAVLGRIVGVFRRIP